MSLCVALKQVFLRLIHAAGLHTRVYASSFDVGEVGVESFQRESEWLIA